ncbi:MAG: sulfite exporter TauE/SafE family protein [Actinobacteria bacterium]|nr:sulfite exporter TauE/SafE family protein [Actinomycetota bacterium]
MTWWNAAILLLAGVGGGLVGSIAGLASLTTYPALLAVGLPPVAANVTNTVALVFNGVGSIAGSRPELRGQGPWLVRTVPLMVLGGAAGAGLLLLTPASGFEKLVPILIALASLTIVLPRRALDGAKPRKRRAVVLLEGAAIFLVGVYAGYFGAAAGVVLLALLLRAGGATLAHANAAKNVMLGISNSVAAVAFAFLAPVDWLAVVPLGIGCLIGSRLGPVVVRHSPATPLRILIGVAGLCLAVKLGIDAYS